MKRCPAAAVFVLVLAAALPSARAQEMPTLNAPALSLQEALRIAARNNVALKQVQADANAASAEALGAKAATSPSLSTTTYATVGDSANILTSSPGVVPQNIFAVPSHGFADQNLMLMVPLFTGGKLGSSAAAARRQEEAARLSVQASRLTVAEGVTSDYATVAFQQALVDTAQTRLTAEEEQVRVTQEKVDTGRSAPVDLLREQAELADAQQALLAAQNNVALALVNLKTTLGISQASALVPADTLDSLLGSKSVLPATLRNALSQAEAHRPEIASSQKLIEAAQSRVSAAKGEYAPQVYGVAMGDASTGQGIGSSGYTLGLTASLPLYDGGQRRADVDGAKARLDRARADALQTRQKVDQQAASAWLTMQTAAAQVQAASAGVTAAQESYQLAALRYSVGKSIAAERLDALTAQTRAQGTLAQAKAQLVIARAMLQAAIGGETR